MDSQKPQKIWIFDQKFVPKVLIIFLALFTGISGYGAIFLVQQLSQTVTNDNQNIQDVLSSLTDLKTEAGNLNRRVLDTSSTDLKNADIQLLLNKLDRQVIETQNHIQSVNLGSIIGDDLAIYPIVLEQQETSESSWQKLSLELEMLDNNLTNVLLKTQKYLLEQESGDRPINLHLVILSVSSYLLLAGLCLTLLLFVNQLRHVQKKGWLTSHFDHKLYKEIVENAEEGIWILDPSLNIVYVNSKLSEILSIANKDLLAKNALELCVSEASSLSLEETLGALDADNSVNLDLCLVNTQNQPVWFYANNTLIDFYGQGDRHILGLLTDITERKQIEEDLKSANERLTHQANFDELTQIANRRYFNLYAVRTWKHAVREQQPLSLVIADIDFFKKYNDHYGHLQGDICLFQVAQVISASAQRQYDLAARYGGEEFVLLFPNTTEQEVQNIIEALQQELATLQINHKMSTVKKVITLSLGVVSGIPNEKLTLEQALNLADEALYQAKNNGRNQYILWHF